MEAQSIICNNTRRSAGLATVLMIALLCALASPTNAQTFAVRSADDNQTQQWAWGQTEQSFPEVKWDIVNAASPRGCLVTWSATPFAHQNGQASMDISLRLRVVSGQPARARWKVQDEFDQSDLSRGRSEAVVTLASERRGAASVGIVVSAVTDQQTLPVAGSYSTSLVATLSGI